MNKSSFNNGIISGAILKNNIKRYIPFMCFAVLYFVIIYVIPTTMAVNGEVFIERDVSSSMAGVRVYCAFAPLMLAIAMFSFLHKNNAVIFYHSLPFNRIQIFISTVISAIVIINVPNLLFCLYVAVRVSMEAAIGVFVYGLIASMFSLAICTLAAIISGTVSMHIITSIWLSVLLQSIYGVVLMFCTAFLNGYSINDAGTGVMSMSPITFMDWHLSSWFNLIFLAVALILFAAAAILYKHIKLERCENAITFKVVKLVLNLLAGIYMMALIGIIFYMVYQNTVALVTASLIGAILGVLIGYMLLNKTFKIFNVKTFRLSVIMVIASMLFLGTFTFDIYGYEDDVPNINDVKSVKINENIFSSSHYYVDSQLFNEDSDVFTDRDIISNVIKIHEEMAKKDRVPINQNEAYYTFSIKYTLKDGDTMSRKYVVPYKMMENSAEMKYIYESKEFKEQTSLSNLKYTVNEIQIEKLTDANDENNANEDTSLISITDRNEIDEFIQAYNLDFTEETYEERKKNLNNAEYIMWMEFDSRTYSVDLNESDEHVMEFLKAHGYSL